MNGHASCEVTHQGRVQAWLGTHLYWCSQWEPRSILQVDLSFKSIAGFQVDLSSKSQLQRLTFSLEPRSTCMVDLGSGVKNVFMVLQKHGIHPRSWPRAFCHSRQHKGQNSGELRIYYSNAPKDSCSQLAWRTGHSGSSINAQQCQLSMWIEKMK